MSRKKLFVETIEKDEASRIAAVSKSVIERMKSLYGGKQALRDTHVKTHACIDANLEIFDFDEDKIKADLKERLNLSDEQFSNIAIKQGLFAVAKKYRSLLRFANGTIRTDSDNSLDTRSMSVKVYDVEGLHLDESYNATEQDIITQNSEVFFVRGIKDYHSFFNAAGKGTWRTFFWLLIHPYQAFKLFQTVKRKPLSLLTEIYWSGSASSVGEQLTESETAGKKEITYPLVVKYGFFPTSSEAPFKRISANKRASKVEYNYYRDDLISRLSKSDARYFWDFAIQVQAKPCHSVEDVTIDWPEKEAPFFTVGRLCVESQVVDADKQFELGENLRYSPWNGLKVHRPLGELNRLRGAIYPIVAKIRQESKELG